MERKGKSLENIINLIQKTLKDSPETKVFKNYKIQNNGGRDREFDVFIESKINGFEIKIAIECKDYKGRVAVEKIEAFESKCKRIIGINKKVFVSSFGFQADAIKAASEFGIELEIAEKLNPEAILNWMPISNITFKILKGGNSTLIIDTEEELRPDINIPIDSKFDYNGVQTNIDKIVSDILNSYQNKIYNLSLLIWMKLENEKKKLPFFIPFNVRFREAYNLDFENKTYRIIGLQLNIKGIYERTSICVNEIRELKDINGRIKAETLTIQTSDDVTMSFVKTPDNNTTVHVSENNEKSTQLKVLAVYDPKTNNLEVMK